MRQIERLMPATSIDSTMRLISHMVDIEDGGYVRFEDHRREVERIEGFLNSERAAHQQSLKQWEKDEDAIKNAVAIIGEMRSSTAHIKHIAECDYKYSDGIYIHKCSFCRVADELLNEYPENDVEQQDDHFGQTEDWKEKEPSLADALHTSSRI